MAGGAGIFILTMNSAVMGRLEVLPIAGGLGAMSSWGREGNDCGHNQDGQAVFWQKN